MAFPESLCICPPSPTARRRESAENVRKTFPSSSGLVIVNRQRQLTGLLFILVSGDLTPRRESTKTKDRRRVQPSEVFQPRRLHGSCLRLVTLTPEWLWHLWITICTEARSCSSIQVYLYETYPLHTHLLSPHSVLRMELGNT